MESFPQLATQWAAVSLTAVTALVDRSPFGGMSAVQCTSITTSTLAIVFSIVSYIAQNRRKQWIRPGYLPLASLLPLGCLTLSSILSATVSFRFGLVASYGSIDCIASETRFPCIFVLNCLYLTSTLFTIILLLMPCICACCNTRCCKITRTLIHLCLSGVLPATIICVLAYDHSCMLEIINTYDIPRLFVFIMFCLIVHFLLGVVVFSGLNFARLFAPILFFPVYLIRK